VREEIGLQSWPLPRLVDTVDGNGDPVTIQYDYDLSFAEDGSALWERVELSPDYTVVPIAATWEHTEGQLFDVYVEQPSGEVNLACSLSKPGSVRVLDCFERDADFYAVAFIKDQ
jgi:hypothetical protein